MINLPSYFKKYISRDKNRERYVELNLDQKEIDLGDLIYFNNWKEDNYLFISTKFLENVFIRIDWLNYSNKTEKFYIFEVHGNNMYDVFLYNKNGIDIKTVNRPEYNLSDKPEEKYFKQTRIELDNIKFRNEEKERIKSEKPFREKIFELSVKSSLNYNLSEKSTLQVALSRLNKKHNTNKRFSFIEGIVTREA